MPPPATVLFIRHAQSTWNSEARWQGQADPPLSEDGEAQIEAAARRLTTGDPHLDQRVDWHFDVMVSSDLKRARSTAEGLAAGLGIGPPLLLEPELREYDVGQWSGLTRTEIEARWPEQLAAFDAGRLDSPPGGESRAAFDLRVRRAADLLNAQIVDRDARRSLVVTHGGVIRSLARIHGVPDGHVGNLSGYEARPGPGGLDGFEPVNLLTPPGPQLEPAASDEQDAL